ncbi:MAG: hypothetical protein ACOYLS_08855 [Polymorphobacter sp.]
MLATAFAAVAGAKPAAPLQPYVITVASGAQPYVPVRVKNADLNIRLALSFDGALILNLAPAQRAGLKPFPLIGKRTFKNALLPGGEATFRGNLYGITPRGLAKTTVPAIWVDKVIADDADGVLAATALKADRIIFNLGPQAPGAKIYTIPRKDKGAALMEARVGDESIDVALELNSPDTVMNARAAAALAGAGLIKRAGEVGFWRPFPGIALPFERLTPVAGARLLGLPLGRAGVRITEAQAKALDARAKAGTSTADDDADAITVTATRKKGRDPWILIGRDMLDKCSKIEFDRPGKAWHLTCAF